MDDAGAVGFADGLELDDVVAGARWRAEVEVLFDDLPRRLDTLDLVEHFDAALDLRRLGSLRFEALDETRLFGQHGLLARERGLALLRALLARVLVKIVVSAVGRDLAAVEL